MAGIFVTAGATRITRAVVLCVFLAAFAVQSAFATESVTLAWDASTSPDVVGYRVYYGTASRDYTHIVSVTNGSAATVSGLVEGTTYYFAVTAFNSAGLESVPSNEVSYTVPGVTLTIQPLPAQQPLASAFQVSSTGVVPYAWSLQESADLKTWRTLAQGTNSAVNVPAVSLGAPAMFFRVVAQ